MKKLSLDERGMNHVVLAVLAVMVIGGVGFAAWRVMGSKKTTDSAYKGTTADTVAANKEAEDACNKLYKDGDLCKFASYANLGGATYKATFTTSGKDAASSSVEMAQDGKGNYSSITKENGKETGAFILLNGDTYTKDITSGSWIKYPKNPEAPKNDVSPVDDVKFDFKHEESQPADKRVSYKKLGKEKCGSANCFKYQMIDPNQQIPESIIWFGDKDYLLYKLSYTDEHKITNTGEFTYSAVTISAPTPVKAAPVVRTDGIDD